MNIVCVPFHDYKVALKEGFRTRDTHIYGSWEGVEKVEKIVILNRPTLMLESILGRRDKLTEGEVVYSSSQMNIVKVSSKTFVVDVLRWDIIGPVLKGKAYIPSLYWRSKDYFHKALQILEVHDFISYESSPLSKNLINYLHPRVKIFDGVDNFCKHESYQPLKGWLESEYQEIISNYENVYFNSRDSISYFNSSKKSNVEFIANGVDFERFKATYPKPSQLESIPGKVAIYAGKMQSMFDVDLVKECASKYPDISWVFLGKVLEGNIDSKFDNFENVFFLGDIHYDELPAYITNADLCIIPYRIEKQHGGDPIKFYEYLASGLPIVSTNIGEIAQYSNELDVFVVEKNDFVVSISKAIRCEKNITRTLPNNMTWSSKSEYMVNKALLNKS
ncbi:hypothetical protein C1E23_01290 [Pseudoalteromonas phenolica]|uniref:Uncharacterized protein n=1 Tax=Pseudoalteromonas phenolica TaxID=161398 RepID=A0A4Q7IUE5_9GAMM|nr:glycosyltransferase [Pseudoalteromonas phenolica]RZQ54947.1 hypothetical protein C1E23_01290 [Pseudoalteromonas phenolica]